MARHIETEIYQKNCQIIAISSAIRSLKGIVDDIVLRQRSLEGDLQQAIIDLQDLIHEQNGNKNHKQEQ